MQPPVTHSGLEVGERGEDPDAVGAEAEPGGECLRLTGMSAALRLLALAGLEPREASECRGNVRED